MAQESCDIVIVLTNAPDQEFAARLAASLIEHRYAACVNILDECTSVYRWKGALTTATEVPMLIKTTATGCGRVEEVIRAMHPYELPEILRIPVAGGLTAYLDWIQAESSGG